MKPSVAFKALILICLTACRQSAPADTSGELLSENDSYPFLTEHEGIFYMTTQNLTVDSILMCKAENVPSLAGAQSILIWSDPGMRNIYSPELHLIDGRWYIYFEADNGENTDTHQLYVLENPSADPASWHKEPEPFFRGTPNDAGAFGVSNISMVKDPQAPGYYLLYQSKHKDPQRGDNISTIRWKHIDWNPDSLPSFGMP